MAPTRVVGKGVEFFVAAGWRQFTLDKQFKVTSACAPLAELCVWPAEKLAGSSFPELFRLADRERLQIQLSQLKSTSISSISSLLVMLQVNGQAPIPVELMLYPAAEKSAQGDYVGFIRPIPETFASFFEEKVSQQLGFKPKHVERIAQLGRHIAAILDLDTLLDYVVKSLSQDFGYSYTSIFLVDDDETTVTLRARSGVPVDATHHISLPIDSQTVIGRVSATAKPIQVPNTRRYQYDQPSFLSIKPQSELAVPIVSGREVLGVVDVQSELPYAFQTGDLVLLQTIASQLAVAVANARLLEERDRRMVELSTFNQIGVALVGHQDLESTLSNILRRVSGLFQVEAVSLMLLEEDGLHFAVAIGEGAEEIKSFVLKPGQGIAWSVVEKRQSIRVDDVKADARHFSDIDAAINFSTHALLAVPVQIHDRVLGVIEVMNRRDGLPFSRDNEVTLEFIASAVAVVLENARLFEETQQQLNALTTLTQASEAITKAPDLKQLLEVVLDATLSMSGAEVGAITLTDDLMPQTLRLVVGRGYQAETIEQFNRLNLLYDVGVFGKAFRSGEIVMVDRATDPQLGISGQLATVVPSSFTAVPLFSQGDFVGIIILHTLPNAATRAMLKAVAEIAAVAIDKARLYGKTNQWLAEVLTLYTLADQLTNVLDLNLSYIIESSVGILRHALDCSCCCLFLKEQFAKGETLALKACSGRSEFGQRTPETEYIMTLAKELVRQPRSLYLEDITVPHLVDSSGQTLPEPPPLLLTPVDPAQAEPRLCSVMMVPLAVKDRVLGVLSIDHRKPKAFSQSEDRLLTIAAAQISTAIDNVRLYNDLEQHAAELELALGELREANRLKSEFVQNVSHELRTPLTFVLAYVELIREGSLGQVPAEIQNKLTIISEKTRAITRLVDDVVSLQKIEAGNLRFEAIAPHQLVSNAISGASASAAEHRIEIVAHSLPDLPAVWVDVDRIGQVFDNLISNAIKFSLTGGKIEITAEQANDFIKFSVHDYGIGIPADKLERIFERFYQVDGSTTRRYRGAGLGLAIVKQIVEAHSGHVTVVSEPNKNTIFSFYLPVYRGEIQFESA